MIEISHNDEILAIIDNINNFKPGLNFYGKRDDFIQIGTFFCNTSRKMHTHRHLKRPRVVEKTQEILIVFKGSCEVTTYSKIGKEIVHKYILKSGDFYISYFGGVGFKILEDNTIMMEVKNGPYNVINDDEDRELL